MVLTANNNQKQADGGYWYVVGVGTDSAGRTVPLVPAETSFCAWYGKLDGITYAAVRCIAAVAIQNPISSVTLQQVLAAAGYSGTPYGRVGGE